MRGTVTGAATLVPPDRPTDVKLFKVVATTSPSKCLSKEPQAHEHTYSPRPTLSSTTNKEKQVEPHLPGSPTRFQVRGEAMGTDWAIWIWQVLAPSISTWWINKIVLFFSKNLVMVPPPLDSSVAHSARHECPSAQRPSSSG